MAGGSQSLGGGPFSTPLGLLFSLRALRCCGTLSAIQLSPAPVGWSPRHTQLSLLPLGYLCIFKKWKCKADGLVLLGLCFIPPILASR